MGSGVRDHGGSDVGAGYLIKMGGKADGGLACAGRAVPGVVLGGGLGREPNKELRRVGRTEAGIGGRKGGKVIVLTHGGKGGDDEIVVDCDEVGSKVEFGGTECR